MQLLNIGSRGATFGGKNIVIKMQVLNSDADPEQPQPLTVCIFSHFPIGHSSNQNILLILGYVHT